MLAIIKRELFAYLHSPIGWIFLSAMNFFSGYYFFGYCLVRNSTDMANVFNSMFTICVLLIPILTMRLVSEDKKNGTDQLLLTSPVSLFAVVFGKYIAATVMFLFSIVQLFAYALVLDFYATIQWPMIVCYFFGLFLLGIALIAIGLLVSSCTENQIIAAIGSFSIGLLLLSIDSLSGMFQNAAIAAIIQSLSFYKHYFSLIQGILQISDIIYFVSVTAFTLFLTIRIFERRRWQ